MHFIALHFFPLKLPLPIDNQSAISESAMHCCRLLQRRHRCKVESIVLGAAGFRSKLKTCSVQFRNCYFLQKLPGSLMRKKPRLCQNRKLQLQNITEQFECIFTSLEAEADIAIRR